MPCRQRSANGEILHALDVEFGTYGFEKARSSKTFQVFSIAVRPEDQALLWAQPRALAQERRDHRLFTLSRSEAQGATRIVSDQRLPPSRHHLAVNLIRITSERVFRVQH